MIKVTKTYIYNTAIPRAKELLICVYPSFNRVYASQIKVCCVVFYGQETFDKEVIRIRKSKDRQHNGQKKKVKRTNNYIKTLHRKQNR